MLGHSDFLYLVWTFVVQRPVRALCVIEGYVVIHRLPELCYRAIISPVQFLPFQTGKEGLRHGVVVGTARAGKGLLHMTGEKKLLE